MIKHDVVGLLVAPVRFEIEPLKRLAILDLVPARRLRPAFQIGEPRFRLDRRLIGFDAKIDLPVEMDFRDAVPRIIEFQAGQLVKELELDAPLAQNSVDGRDHHLPKSCNAFIKESILVAAEQPQRHLRRAARSEAGAPLVSFEILKRRVVERLDDT